MRTSSVMLLASVLPSACASAPSPTATRPPVVAQTAPVGGTADAAPNLPRWSRPRPAAPAGVHVAIGPDGLRVDGTLLAPLPPKELRSHGFDASYKSKPNSLVLVPLVAALDAPHSPDAVLDVDPETSYRVLTEVFFTLAQHGVSGFHFLVEYDTSSGPAVGSVDVYAPARGPNGLPEGNPTAPLVVRLRPDGLLLRGSGKNIPAECGDTTRIDAQLTYDFAAVTRCGAALKKPDKLTDDLLLVASPEVPFRLVVATMDALAQDYPHVNFGIMR